MSIQPFDERRLGRLEDGESTAAASRDCLILRLRGLFLCAVLPCSRGSAGAEEASTASAEALALDQTVALAQENNRLVKIRNQSSLQANENICGPGVATFLTLLLVPVLYAIFVLDLKLATWGGPASGSESASTDLKGGLP